MDIPLNWGGGAKPVAKAQGSIYVKAADFEKDNACGLAPCCVSSTVEDEAALQRRFIVCTASGIAGEHRPSGFRSDQD